LGSSGYFPWDYSSGFIIACFVFYFNSRENQEDIQEKLIAVQSQTKFLVFLGLGSKEFRMAFWFGFVLFIIGI
jgi:hypothetical protein